MQTNSNLEILVFFGVSFRYKNQTIVVILSQYHITVQQIVQTAFQRKF